LIDTADKMTTTAGSLALAGSIAPQDSFVVFKLRQAGVIILGKTNLSEWANFRSGHSSSGWSSRGGQTKNSYALDRNPSGSSSGWAVAVAANLCAVAVGTETYGSIIGPSLRKHQLDAIVAPSGGPAWLTDWVNGDGHSGGSSSPAAVAGYPNITVPAGYIFGLPIGISFFSGAYQEPKLIKLAFAFEQATRICRPPQFLTTLPI
jgi:amidase